MSEGGALMRFHDWRATRDRKVATRRLWRSRCIGLVAVPVSNGSGRLCFCTRRLRVVQKFSTGC